RGQAGDGSVAGHGTDLGVLRNRSCWPETNGIERNRPLYVGHHLPPPRLFFAPASDFTPRCPLSAVRRPQKRTRSRPPVVRCAASSASGKRISTLSPSP